VTARPAVLVDVSQFVAHPVTTGVQRVVLHLLEQAPGDRIDWIPAFLDGSDYVTLTRAAVVDVMQEVFDRRSRSTGTVDERAVQLRVDLDRVAVGREAINSLPENVAAYLLPEPTMQRDVLGAIDRLQADGRVRCAFVFHDAIPATRPADFPAGGVERFDEYLHRLVRSDAVACVSDPARRELEERLRRRPLAHGAVVRNGSDGLAPAEPMRFDRPTFVVTGSIEPRKRQDLVLAAFRSLWDDGVEAAVVFAGRMAQPIPGFETQIDLFSPHGLASWWRDASDQRLAAAIQGSAGVIFVSRAEGYGLPLVEALRLGAPVIVDDAVPALEGLPAGGQLRVAEPDVAALAAAVRELLDDDRNRRLRQDIPSEALPTWRDFAAGIEAWMAGILRPAG
jgi:glycosyltransferase involved in cell wall biosynthesis